MTSAQATPPPPETYVAYKLRRPFRVWSRTALLLALWAVACESPLGPNPCGSIPEVTVHVGETSSVTPCFNDPNGDMLVYAVASSNPSVASASVAGTAVTVTGIAPGSATVTLTARDPGGLQGQQSFTVTVPNRAPQPRGTPPNISVRVGAIATVDMAEYFTDPDGETLTYTASPSDPEVAGVSVTGSVVTVTALAKGSATVTVTARDPGGLSAMQSFRFAVPNRPPVAVGTLQAQTIRVGESATLDVADSFSDPDGDALGYTAASSVPSVARTSVAGSVVTITAAGPGTATVTITASDDEPASATQQVSVTVPQPNRPPRRVGAIPNQTIEVGRAATVNAARYFSDPDGDTLTYAASSSNGGVARVSVSDSTVTITAASPGTAVITVTASDPEGLSATQEIRVRVERAGAPDLEFTSVTPTSVTGSPGGSVQAVFTLRNTGNAPAPATTIRVYQSTNSSISTSDTQIGSGPTSSLSAGQSRTITGTVELSSQASGTFYFGICADAVSGESDTTNNCSTGVRVTVTSSGAPDLEFTNVTPTSVTGSVGGSVQADFTIRNTGNGAAPATTIRLYESSNSTISTTDDEIGRTAFSGLAAGQSRTITGTVRNLTAGSFYFGICIDAVSGESDTANNCSQGVRVTVGGSGSGPDLVVSLSRSSVTVSPGSSFSYDLTVRNQGDAVSAATRARTLVSADATISTNDNEIGGATVPSLNPSAEASGEVTVSIRAGAPAGTVYVGNCVDAVSGESDTSNNCSSAITVTIQTSSSSDTTYTTGQTIETLPTGFWTPDASGGGTSFQYSNGVATVRFNGTSSYIVENNIRYSCLSTAGCEIVNRRVTKGSIRASRQSSGGLVAEPQWDDLLDATGAEWTVIRRPGDDPPAASLPVEGILRVKPGTEPENDGTSQARRAVTSATISASSGSR